jgi:hypothetical protein
MRSCQGLENLKLHEGERDQFTVWPNESVTSRIQSPNRVMKTQLIDTPRNRPDRCTQFGQVDGFH